MNKEVVKELIQEQLTEKNLAFELNQILNNKEKIASIQEDYKQLKDILSQGGPASLNAARIIVQFSNSPSSPA